MKIRSGWLGIKYLTITMILSQGISFNALAHGARFIMMLLPKNTKTYLTFKY